MSSGLYSGVSGLALGTGLYRDISGLWSGASGLIAGFGGEFTPASLFVDGESGYWLDPSDFSTMWQDSQGVTPVTATGQTVGLILDKRIGTRTQVFDDANVTFGGSAGYSGRVSPGVYEYARDASGSGQVIFGGLTAGKTYLVSLQLSAYAGAIPGIAAIRADYFNAVSGVLRPITITAGTYTFFFLADGAFFRISAGGPGVGGTISNVSILEVAGNHFLQATAGNRPILGVEPAGGRRNLLTFTEQFDNAAWVKSNVTASSAGGVSTIQQVGSLSGVATSASQNLTYAAGSNTFSALLKGENVRYVRVSFGNLTAGGGAGDFDLQTNTVSSTSGTATGVSISSADDGYSKVVITLTADAGDVSGNVLFGLLEGPGDPTWTTTSTSNRLLVKEPQIEQGTTATAYQRVTDQWNVTQAGVPDCYYVAFDGTDDWLQSAATINPGAVDKAQVFAGARKLSDAAIGMILESSANINTNNGTLALWNGRGSSGGTTYTGNSKGTTLGQAGAATGTATSPVTNVLTLLGDISGDSAILRVNGVEAATSATDQGTGNYLTYTHYIGRRGGTTLPYNGRIYQTVMRYGPNLDAAQIDDTEDFVAIKTGFFAPQITGVPTIS